MNVIQLIVKGMAMGVAEVIPGVSGGTIAFITGIYEQLINSIKSVDRSFFGLVIKFKLKDAFYKVNGPFLLKLMIGMVIGIVIGVFGVSYLMEQYPTILWSFFFGLIFVSIFYLASKIEKIKLLHIGLFVLGTIIAFCICILNPLSGSTNLIAVFIAGSIAISALILPGISGSFILLILGMYSIILNAGKGMLTTFSLEDLSIVFTFGLGALLGLAVFSRVLSWTFKHYESQTFAVLGGFMFGSLYKVWPWRNPLNVLDKNTGNYLNFENSPIPMDVLSNPDYKVLTDTIVMPAQYFTESFTLFSLLAFLIGGGIVFILWVFEK